MPTAICMKCGEAQRWSNKRGVKLAEIPCSKCGGKLRARTKEESKRDWAAYWARVKETRK